MIRGSSSNGFWQPWIFCCFFAELLLQLVIFCQGSVNIRIYMAGWFLLPKQKSSESSRPDGIEGWCESLLHHVLRVRVSQNQLWVQVAALFDTFCMATTCSTAFLWTTLPETSSISAPENRPGPKGNDSIPTIDFQVRTVTRSCQQGPSPPWNPGWFYYYDS